MLEIECKRCHAKHFPRRLGKSLICSCTYRPGMHTALIVEVHDAEAGERWFTVTNQATVRVKP